MAIPDFQTLMLPLMQLAADGKEHSIGEAREALATQFQLTEQDRHELLPSGRQPRFDNRVAWAKSFLQQAGLLTAPRRAHFQISDRGRTLLQDKPSLINIKLLERYPEFVEFRSSSRKKEPETGEIDTDPSEHETPEEMLESAHQRIRTELAADLLTRVRNSSPQFFERLVVDLLVNMGYGGSRKDAGEAVGRSGDEGIDGIINEDRLGLDTIYLQAKKWDGTVGRPEIHKFVGALHGKRAKKGVFITTSTFSAEAYGYVAHIDPKVVLIDGRQLAQLMIDFNLGVTAVQSYEVKRIDSDFFSEE
jgi:restriction system protein